MKVLQKILVILLISMCIAVIIPQCTVNADDIVSSVLDNVKANVQDNATGKLQSVVNSLLGFLQIASALIAVVMIAVTGFRYIVETPDMKSELKKSMIPIIVGILLVFFAVTIAKFFVGLFQNGDSSQG